MAKKKKPFTAKNVARELGQEIDEKIDPDDLEEDEVWEEDVFKLERGNGNGYVIFKDDDSAEEAALRYVKDMLENEPELFNQSFIESHIDDKKLKEWVYDAEMEDSYADDLAEDDPEQFWREAEGWGIEPDEEDEDGEMPDPEEDDIEALKEAIAKDRSKNPMSYLEDIYGRDEAVKKAFELVGIDIDAAAKDAVDSDGWAHFLSRYDGNYEETDSGFIFYRE